MIIYKALKFCYLGALFFTREDLTVLGFLIFCELMRNILLKISWFIKAVTNLTISFFITLVVIHLRLQ